VTIGTEVDLPAPRGRATPGTVPARVTRLTRGSRADIKADRRASVEMSDDLTRAESVMVIQGPDPNAPPEGL
jgi:hypothetical protein